MCISIDMHICEGEVWSISFIGNADNCDKSLAQNETEIASCCMLNAPTKGNPGQMNQLSKEHCCYQETIVNNFLYGKEQPTSLDSEHHTIAILSIPNENYISSFPIVNARVSTLPSPPVYKRDYQSLFQIFLI